MGGSQIRQGGKKKEQSFGWIALPAFL